MIGFVWKGTAQMKTWLHFGKDLEKNPKFSEMPHVGGLHSIITS